MSEQNPTQDKPEEKCDYCGGDSDDFIEVQFDHLLHTASLCSFFCLAGFAVKIAHGQYNLLVERHGQEVDDAFRRGRAIGAKQK